MIVLVDPDDPSKGYKIVPIAEEDVPLAIREGIHKDCIFPFICMTVAFITELVYFNKKKKYQQRIYELTEQIAVLEK